MGSSNQLLIKKAKPLSVNKFVVRFFVKLRKLIWVCTLFLIVLRAVDIR